MNEERIARLLHSADEAAGPPSFGTITAARIRQRVHRRRVVRTAAPLAVAAAALIVTTVGIVSVKTREPQPGPERIASLETQVKQLQAQTETALRLIREVLEEDRQERRLAALKTELASIPDPMRQIDQQVDRTAFILVYQADRLYKELNERESAVEAYKEVIQLFPDNQWADIARQRLSEIERRQINRSDPPDRKGDTPCEPRNV